MSEIKVRLSMTIPGAVMLSSQECDKNPKENYDVTKLLVKGDNKKDSELITVAMRKAKPAKQSVSITKEAYESMVSNEFRCECPSLIRKYPKHVWLKLNRQQRLEAHLAILAESLGAISFTYEVLDD